MFKTELVTKRDMRKDFSWTLTSPLVWEDDKYKITVKEGFDFDFASIPWLFRRVLPKNGKSYDRAACVHDALYAAQALSKKECDNIFYDAMVSDNTDKAIAEIMYLAVKTGGASAYEDVEELDKYKKLIEVKIK